MNPYLCYDLGRLISVGIDEEELKDEDPPCIGQNTRSQPVSTALEVLFFMFLRRQA